MTSFTSKKIIVDVKDIFSIASMDNDDIGYDDADKDDIVAVTQYIDQVTGATFVGESLFSLSGDAHTDKDYLEWILSKKSKDDYTTDIF